MSNPSQLFLLADHIKLSLLERQRAISLKIEQSASQESNISSSLESLRAGIESLSTRSSDSEAVEELRSQYHDLSRQFHGERSTSTTAETLTTPNDPSLAPDFEQARTRSSNDHEGSKPKNTATTAAAAASKNVRFRDNPSEESLDAENEANRAALFPERYTDDQPPTPDPTTDMDNQQIHAYHQQVISEQDDQLDRLGESISRQRYLSMQIGDELEGQIALLDDVESGVDRHQSRLDGAKKRLNKVGEKAKANWGMTTIVVLIVILVLLIVVLK